MKVEAELAAFGSDSSDFRHSEKYFENNLTSNAKCITFVSSFTKKIKIMKISVSKLVDYICENCNIKSPGTRDQYTIWSRNGELLMTRGSHEFRGEEERIISIDFLNEFAPYSKKDVKNMVEYSLN